jgi:hypothetical protein
MQHLQCYHVIIPNKIIVFYSKLSNHALITKWFHFLNTVTFICYLKASLVNEFQSGLWDLGNFHWETGTSFPKKPHL